MTVTAIHTPRLARSQPRLPLGARILRTMGLARERRALAGLEPHLLTDIGLSHAEAQREARRPVWDAPAHWRQRR